MDMDSIEEEVVETMHVPPLPPLLADNFPPAEAAAAFPPLESIWKDQYCVTTTVKGKPGWKCLRCGYEAIANGGGWIGWVGRNGLVK